MSFGRLSGSTRPPHDSSSANLTRSCASSCGELFEDVLSRCSTISASNFGRLSGSTRPPHDSSSANLTRSCASSCGELFEDVLSRCSTISASNFATDKSSHSRCPSPSNIAVRKRTRIAVFSSAGRSSRSFHNCRSLLRSGFWLFLSRTSRNFARHSSSGAGQLGVARCRMETPNSGSAFLHKSGTLGFGQSARQGLQLKWPLSLRSGLYSSSSSAILEAHVLKKSLGLSTSAWVQ